MKKEKRELIREQQTQNAIIRLNRELYCYDIGASNFFVSKTPMVGVYTRFREIVSGFSTVSNAMGRVFFGENDYVIWNDRTIDFRTVGIDDRTLVVYTKSVAPNHVVNSRFGRMFEMQVKKVGDHWPAKYSEFNTRMVFRLPTEMVMGEPYDTTTVKSKPRYEEMKPSKAAMDEKVINYVSKPIPYKTDVTVKDIESVIPGFVEFNAYCTSVQDLMDKKAGLLKEIGEIDHALKMLKTIEPENANEIRQRVAMMHNLLGSYLQGE